MKEFFIKFFAISSIITTLVILLCIVVALFNFSEVTKWFKNKILHKRFYESLLTSDSHTIYCHMLPSSNNIKDVEESVVENHTNFYLVLNGFFIDFTTGYNRVDDSIVVLTRPTTVSYSSLVYLITYLTVLTGKTYTPIHANNGEVVKLSR